MRAGLALLLLLSTMLGGNCQDTDSPQGGHTVTSQLSMVLQELRIIRSRLNKIENEVQDLKGKQTIVKEMVNETKVHLSHEVFKLNVKLSETTDVFSSQSDALSSKVDSLSTQTEYLTSSVNTFSSQSNALVSNITSLSESMTSSVDTLSSNTDTLTTRVALVASRMDGLTSAFTDSPLSIQVQNLTSLAGMAKDILQDIQQAQTLSSIIDKIPSTSSCTQLSEDYPMASSGYYWMTDQTSSPVSTYCIINLELNPALSCQQLARDHPFGESDYYWLKHENGSIVNTYCIITSELNPASSCQQLARDHPHAAPDYYWVSNGAMQPVKVYCDMDQHCCNSTGGWVRVANIDMTDTNQQCPPGFNLRTDVRSCDKSYRGYSCTPITIPSHSIEYRQVCGRIRAYQYGWTYAFHPYLDSRSITIEDRYVFGMSLTHGRHPRQHIWTFASARSEYYSKDLVCPCTRTDRPYIEAPPFIGDDYFCDTAVTATQVHPTSVVRTDDPLWDGQGCGPTSTCCSFNRPPWFCKQLPQPTTDDLELRVCGYSPDGITPFDQIEIYIQ